MKMIEEKKVRIVLALHQAGSPSPLGYISKHTEIEDLRHLLDQLEEDGIVQKVPANGWSSSNDPQYELTAKAKGLLQELIVARLEQVIEVSA